jgi:hypothetical protein
MKPTPTTPVVEAAKLMPPSSAPPPAPVPVRPGEEDWRKLAIERLVKDFHLLQLHYNAKLPPPTDWQTVWFAEWEKLYAMTEERGAALRHWMLIDLMAVSQVHHANAYTSPSMILDAKLADEIIRLRTEDTFAQVWDAHWEVVCPVTSQADDELFDELGSVDDEQKERERLKESANCLRCWKKWMEENAAPCESPAAA